MRNTSASGEPILKRFGQVILHTPRYALLVANLARDGCLSRRQRASALACLVYVLLPVDLVPGIIPVIGQLDDLAVLIGGLKLVLRTVDPDTGTEHLRRVGLTPRDVDRDLKVIWDTALWLGREGPGRLRRMLLDSRSSGLRSDLGETSE